MNINNWTFLTSIFFSGLDRSAAITRPTRFTKQSSSPINSPALTEPEPGLGRAVEWLRPLATSHRIKVPKKPGKFCPLDNFSLSKYGLDQIFSRWQSFSCSGRTRWAYFRKLYIIHFTLNTFYSCTIFFNTKKPRWWSNWMPSYSLDRTKLLAAGGSETFGACSLKILYFKVKSFQKVA